MYKVGDEVFIKAEIKDDDGHGKKQIKIKGIDGYSPLWIDVYELIPAGKTYEQGLADAWELAKKITLPYGGNEFMIDSVFTARELESIFGSRCYDEVLSKFTATEALAKIEAYEKEKEIKEGMIVVFAGEGWIVAEIKEEILKLWNGTKIVSADRLSCEPTKGVVEVSNVLGR